jgi:DNA-binding transcriptional MerR regulator
MAATKAGMREFERVAAKGWDVGVPLDELLARVNRVAAKLLPTADERDARISPTLVARTFRHYVTLGCIDPGRREGRRAVYGYRHFLQALLVRRLLADGVPTRSMPELVTGSGNEELRRMVLDGVEVVMRTGSEKNGSGADEQPLSASAFPEVWCRTCVAPGVELHVREDLPRLKPAERRRLIERLEQVFGRCKS